MQPIMCFDSMHNCCSICFQLVFQLIRVVGEIEYLAPNVSVTYATLRPLVMNGILSLSVLRFMICVLGTTACLGPVSPLCVSSCGKMI